MTSGLYLLCIINRTSSSFFTQAIIPLSLTHCLKTCVNVAQMVILWEDQPFNSTQVPNKVHERLPKISQGCVMEHYLLLWTRSWTPEFQQSEKTPTHQRLLKKFKFDILSTSTAGLIHTICFNLEVIIYIIFYFQIQVIFT